MEPEVRQKLLQINEQFYQTFALQFSSTRQRLQPGVQRILKAISSQASILDLGCGNGELWQALARQGHQGIFIGLDSSTNLLQIAREKPLDPTTYPGNFVEGDLADQFWPEVIQRQPSYPEAGFDYIVAFAVLHHIPGQELVRQILCQVKNLLCPGGYFIHSVWQLFNSERLVARIQPWSLVGLASEQLDPGDALMDWREGGYGLRYIHAFKEGELAILAHQSGFSIIEFFASDGENNRLGLYQVWQHVESP